MLKEFQALKIQHAYKYIIFNLNKALTEIVVEKKSSDKDYETFIADLPENECRWAVYDLHYETADGLRTKLVFFSWYVFPVHF